MVASGGFFSLLAGLVFPAAVTGYSFPRCLKTAAELLFGVGFAILALHLPL